MTMRKRTRGFTLIELMISLVMGLIVALAAVGLARAATSTFHEQARTSVTEMSVRTAAERLRADLMRVSYMGTGNIALDPAVAHVAGQDTPLGRARYLDLTSLRGIGIIVGTGSLDATSNGLKPDTLLVAGNVTTDDAYSGNLQAGGLCPNGQFITLDPAADAANYMLAGGAIPTAANLEAGARAAFLPSPAQAPAIMGLARVTDAMNCQHFAPVCAIDTAAGGSGPVVRVHLSGDGVVRPVLFTTDNLAGNCGASDGGPVTIAPVGRVRWQLRPSGGVLAADPNVEPAGLKFDLVRETLDWRGVTIPNTNPEIVAEYAVDMKFGLAVDMKFGQAIPSALEIYDIDSDPGGGGGNIDLTANPAGGVTPGQRGPQGIRSVRFRVAVRTGIPDRTENLPMASPYIARWCAATGPLTACKKWSRVRTIVSEVAMHNQAKMFY